MAISQYDFWFDRQQIRFLEQIVRTFSGFSYQTGMVNGQPPQLVLVPCQMAQTNRMVANLISNLTENTLLTVPLITVYQTGLRGRREDLQNPAYVDTLQVTERNIVNGQYGTQRGNAYTVDRIMPLPFLMEVQVDIWTSNLQQKYMLMEQILPVIYPQFEIQNSCNALDWSAVTICLVDDDFSFSSRTVPVGTNDEIDIMSIKLRIPIWLSAPAKVKRISRIEEVVTNVDEGSRDPLTDDMDFGAELRQVIVTPSDAWVSVDGNVITLLTSRDSARSADGSTPSWLTLLTQYGQLRPTLSRMNLYTNDSIQGAFVSGVIQYGPASNQLIWTIDSSTLPVNTMASVNAVVDPGRSAPGAGLPSASDGQRYLLIDNVGSSAAWGVLAASTNDIIQYDGSSNTWQISFDSSAVTTTQYVLNSFTNRQLRWTGSQWVMAIDGNYKPGYWTLQL